MPSATLHSSRQFVTQLLNSLPWLAQRTNDAAEDGAEKSNPLSTVPDTVKKQLLSLQVLFPNEFVPALDLLDRRLVTRFRICNDKAQEIQARDSHDEDLQNQHGDKVQTATEQMRDMDSETTTTPILQASVQDAANEHAQDEPMIDTSALEHDAHSIYYVRSAQHRSSRYSTSYDTATCYEVRLTAWNCSCPAFAFSAFPAVHPEPAVATYDVSTQHTMEQEQEIGWIFGGVSLGDGMPPVCKHLLACVLVEKCSGIFGAFVEERDVSVEEAAGWAAGWGD